MSTNNNLCIDVNGRLPLRLADDDLMAAKDVEAASMGFPGGATLQVVEGCVGGIALPCAPHGVVGMDGADGGDVALAQGDELPPGAGGTGLDAVRAGSHPEEIGALEEEAERVVRAADGEVGRLALVRGAEVVAIEAHADACGQVDDAHGAFGLAGEEEEDVTGVGKVGIVGSLEATALILHRAPASEADILNEVAHGAGGIGANLRQRGDHIVRPVSSGDGGTEFREAVVEQRGRGGDGLMHGIGCRGQALEQGWEVDALVGRDAREQREGVTGGDRLAEDAFGQHELTLGQGGELRGVVIDHHGECPERR